MSISRPRSPSSCSSAEESFHSVRRGRSMSTRRETGVLGIRRVRSASRKVPSRARPERGDGQRSRLPRPGRTAGSESQHDPLRRDDLLRRRCDEPTPGNAARNAGGYGHPRGRRQRRRDRRNRRVCRLLRYSRPRHARHGPLPARPRLAGGHGHRNGLRRCQ